MSPLTAPQALGSMHEATMAALRGNADAQAFVLADGAVVRLAGASMRALWSRFEGLPLLGTGDAAWAGPLLFPLAREGFSAETLRPLIDPDTMLPLGSIICSRLPAPQLAQHLLPMTDVMLDDGAQMLMRYADPRVLPFWLDMLQGQYRDHAGGCGCAWLHWRPDLTVRSWAAAEPQARPGAPDFPMRLTTAQQQTLTDACFVYLMLGRLLEGDEALAMRAMPANRRYAFVKDQLHRASRHGLTNVADLQAYCAMALVHGPAFDSQPIVAGALKGNACAGWPAVAQAMASAGRPEKGE